MRTVEWQERLSWPFTKKIRGAIAPRERLERDLDPCMATLLPWSSPYKRNDPSLL